jgi:hypothetical protein
MGRSKSAARIKSSVNRQPPPKPIRKTKRKKARTSGLDLELKKEWMLRGSGCFSLAALFRILIRLDFDLGFRGLGTTG